MPTNPFRRKTRSVNDERLQAERGARQSGQYYTKRGYTPQFAEEQADQEFKLAQAIKKKRGLKNIQMGGVSN